MPADFKFKTTLIAAAATVLAALVLVPTALNSNARLEEMDILKLPGVVEQFKSSHTVDSSNADKQAPLVTQAERLGRIFDPPPPPAPPKSSKPVMAPPRPAVSRPAAVSAKFDLVGTSYYAANPEKSYALLDMPAKGVEWVKQGTEIGHLVLEQILDGKIIVSDGSRTFEMAVPVKPQPSLIKGEQGSETVAATDVAPVPVTPSRPTPSTPPNRTRPFRTSSTRSKPTPASSNPPSRPIPAGQGFDQESFELMKEFAARMENMQQSGQPANAREESARMTKELFEKLSERTKASRVTEQEAQKLERLGRELSGRTDPRQSRPDGRTKNASLKTGDQDPNTQSE